jgi:hypothetical protein
VTPAVGRLVNGAGDQLGTVFAVPGSLALTAFHCVGNRASGKLKIRRVRCEWPGGFSNAKVIDSDIGNDVALLHLESGLPPGIEPVFLGRDVADQSPFSAPGYPRDIPAGEQLTVSGTITAQYQSRDNRPVLQLLCHESAGQLSLRGMSGSPVLAGNPSRAVGIIQFNHPRSDREDLAAGATVFATPSTAVLGKWPQLRPSQGADAADLRRIVRSLAGRRPRRTPVDIRVHAWHLLLEGGLGLDEDDLQSDLEGAAADYCHIAIPRARVLIEIVADLRLSDAVAAGARRLDRYLEQRTADTGVRHLGIMTDGAEWRLYHRVRDRLTEAGPTFRADAAKAAAEDLIAWIEGVLGTAHGIKPTPAVISRKLGARSPSYAIDLAELKDIYAQCRGMPSVKLKREMWAKLLTTASGTEFPAGDDTLFVNHTLLVIMAEVIGHAVLGIDAEVENLTAKDLVSGARLANIGINGVVERDFFDWVADVPEGARFIKDLARRLARFDWNQVEHDVMKSLYHSIIDEDVRRRLGEYYTPDWLAQAVVQDCVTDPLSQRVLDPSCGSGTFLFHAIRHYLSAAETDDSLTGAKLITELGKHVSGFDVHPVAVTLARVTYLLAIGMDRLRERDQFTVPVYLCDSLRWGQHDDLFSHKGLSVRTTLAHEDLLYDPEFTGDTIFSDRLKFPDAVLSDASRFDGLMRELADKAVDDDKSQRETLSATFRDHGVPEDCRAMIGQSFTNMCKLHDQKLDHIWGYYVRNLARPVWMARPDNRVDVLVGNPPWLSYRGMTSVQQEAFKAMCDLRKMSAGRSHAPTNNLAALFVARSIELYLKPGGRFGFVMPGGTLKLELYQRFRTGQYSSKTEQVTVAFDMPWDLDNIKPSFFRQSVGAVFGKRTASAADRREIGRKRIEWSGHFADTKTASLAEALPHITHRIVEGPAAGRQSPYAGRFFEGASVLPQVLFLVHDDPTGPLGPGAGRRAVRSEPSRHKPWSTTCPLRDVVEEQFVKYLYLGSCLLPFRLLPPREAVIPWDGGLVDDTLLDRYPDLLRWWRKAESEWCEKRRDPKMSLMKRLNYGRNLSRQFPVPRYRVVYPKSAMYCTAAVVPSDHFREAVVDQQLYWGEAATLGEARYLAAVLNAPVVTAEVRKMQPRGEHNPRDLAQYVFKLPIPAFDPGCAAHQELAELAAQAESVAAAVDLPPVKFEAQRRRIRRALEESGVEGRIDAIVRALLEQAA